MPPNNLNCPTNDLAKIVWMHIVINGLPNYGVPCGLLQEKVDSALKDGRCYLHVLEKLAPAARQYDKEMVTYKAQSAKKSGTEETPLPQLQTFSDGPEMRPNGMLERFFAVLYELKALPNYTKTIGALLGIEPPATNGAALSTVGPELLLALLVGALYKLVEIGYIKGRHLALYLECRIDGEEWTFLAVDNKKPYIDNRPLRVPGKAEIREYRARFMDSGGVFSEWGPTVSIAVTP